MIRMHLDMFTLSSYDGRRMATINAVVLIAILAGKIFTWQWSKSAPGTDSGFGLPM